MLNKKDFLTVGIIFFLSYGFSLWSGVSIKDGSELITFMSIIIGFFLSAIAILHASPLRKVLYKEERIGYPNKWIELIEKYKFTMVFSIISIFVLLLEIDVNFLPNIIREFTSKSGLSFSIAATSSYLFLDIVIVLFKNLAFSFND